MQSGDVVLGNTAPANVTKVAVHNAAHKALTRREVAIASILEHTDDKLEAMQILLSRSSKDEIAAIQRMLEQTEATQGKSKVSPDDELAPNWRKGGYPYKNLMSRRNYEKQKYLLQVELLKMQAWVKETGARVVICDEQAALGGSLRFESGARIEGKDGWTLYSRPAAPVVQYEHTVVATDRGAIVVTLPG